ncbi:MAG: alpha/beta fold hydrolase [Pseudomonadota bacterium]
MAMSKNKTSYDLIGPKNAPIVVLIHGLGLTRQMNWDVITNDLTSRFRVLRYDLYGHGESRKISQNNQISLTFLSDQLIALMDELDIDQAALVGFSLGGMINRRVAMDHPKRVSKMAILNTPHERAKEAQREVEDRATLSEKDGAKATIESTLRRWFSPSFFDHHMDIVNKVREIVLTQDPISYVACRYVLAHGVKELIRPYPPINVPSLVMTCQHDSGSTPVMSYAIAEEIKDSEVFIVPQLRHLGLIENPRIYTEKLIKFLTQKI